LNVKRLYEVVEARRKEIVKDWASRFRAPHETALTPVALVDHVPKFLDELADGLRLLDALVSAEIDRTSTAGKHGVQRFRLGFDLDQVVREYGVLQRCIIEAAKREDVPVSTEECAVLGESICQGIADAVTQYSRQRDAELRRQANEHFAFVAHELRNPLGSARLAYQSLKRRGLLPTNALSNLLDRELSRMGALIESTLSLAQTGDGVELRRDRFRIGSLIADAVGESEIAAQDKQIGIEVLPFDDLEIEADQRLVRSALTNLIGNAVKFTATGRSIRISCTDAGSNVMLEVNDACGGLPEGAIEKIFAPFVQAGADRSGFGLGLAIARQAIEAHGGALRATNRPGEGCTFTIELPKRLRTAP
jgi:signal transduction histidine kinase